MKIVLTGSLGNISRPLAIALVKAKHDVTVISSKAEKAGDIKAIGATPAIGDVSDSNFLQQVFTGADLVYTMVPPTFAATDWKGYIANIGKQYATAIKNAGVKKVLNLSSIGAELATGAGPVSGIHEVEQILNALDGVTVVHLRPGFFYTNFLANIDMVRHAGIIGNNYAKDDRMTLVHPEDIAIAAEAEINHFGEAGSIRFVASDVRTPAEIASVIGAAIGKPELPWVTFSDEEAYNGMTQAGLPDEVAKNYVEMGQAVRKGTIFATFFKENPGISGKRKLEDFAAEFAAAY